MAAFGTFEVEISNLNKVCEHGSLEYIDSNTSFTSVVTSHFQNIQRNNWHGIYVVRQKTSGEVLYIGKSGTIDRNGGFKGQDIPRRLKNVKNNDVPANEWFRRLFEEKGQLVIEYVFLSATPQSPTFVESLLLQAYFNEHNFLPYRNNSF
jgi:hypothetical protein